MLQVTGGVPFRRIFLFASLQCQRSHLSRSVPGLVSTMRFNSSKCGGGQTSKHTVTYKPYVPPCYVSHDKKNMDLNRPMSPHLTVYGPTLPAMTSIVQRITGTILTFYALMLSVGTLFLPNGLESYVTIFQSLNLGFFFTFILKLILAAPFAYHYFNGMRFISWNAAKFLTNKEVYATAKKAITAAGIMTLLFALL